MIIYSVFFIFFCTFDEMFISSFFKPLTTIVQLWRKSLTRGLRRSYDSTLPWRLERCAVCIRVRHSRRDQRRIYSCSRDDVGTLSSAQKTARVCSDGSNSSSLGGQSQRLAHDRVDYQVRIVAGAASLGSPGTLDNCGLGREVLPLVAHNRSVHSQRVD